MVPQVPHGVHTAAGRYGQSTVCGRVPLQLPHGVHTAAGEPVGAPEGHIDRPLGQGGPDGGARLVREPFGSLTERGRLGPIGC